MTHKFINWLKQQSLENFISQDIVKLNNGKYLSYFVYHNTKDEDILSISISDDVVGREVVNSADIKILSFDVEVLKDFQETVNYYIFNKINDYLS